MASFKLDKSATLKQQLIGGGAFAIVIGALFWWVLIPIGLLMVIAGLAATESNDEKPRRH